MKRIFWLMVVSAVLATLGFAQTPEAGSTPDPANVKGCLRGSDGAYTVAEDGTGQIFKVSTSSVDLKPHVGHDVKLVGNKATGTMSSGATDNSIAVTELTMISEQCAAAAAATVGAAVPYSQTVVVPTAGAAAPAATVSTPAVDGAAPAATASAPAVEAAAPAAVSTPPVEAAPAAPAVSPSSATVSTPAVDTTAPPATVSAAPAKVSSPAVEAAPAARPSAHARKLPATQAAAAAAPDTTVSPTPDTVIPAAVEAPTPATTVSPSAETASAPDATTPAPAPAVTHRAGSLVLLIAFVVLVIILGTMAPLIGRWRKRKMLERSGSPNLSFTNEVNTSEAGSGESKPEPRKVA